MLIQIDSYEKILSESFENIVNEINGLYYLMGINVKDILYKDVEKEKMYLEIELIREIVGIKNSLEYLLKKLQKISITNYENLYELYKNKEQED